MATFRLSSSRREFLTGLLGVPVALAACRRQPRQIAGEIVGASADVGHRLRQTPPVAHNYTSVPVAIVGGGIAGLSAAWRFERAGFSDYRLFELEARVGGTAQSGHNSVSAYPWGAHYTNTPMASHRAMVTLFAEMGLLDGVDEHGEPVIAEQFICRDPEERLFYRGRWYEGRYLRAGASSDDLAQLTRFLAEVSRLAGLRDGKGRRAFTLPLEDSSDDAELMLLDRVTMSDWLEHNGFHSPRLLWLVDYACRDDYGSNASEVSAWAGLFYFCARQPGPGKESRPVVTWPEGNGHLVTYLAKASAGKIRTGALVRHIAPVEHGAKIVVEEQGQVTGIAADQVVFASPSFLRRHLIADYRDSVTLEYAPWLVANLSVRALPAGRGFPLCWDNVLYDSPGLGYVVATHQRGIDRGPTVLTYYYPFAGGDVVEQRRALLNSDFHALSDLALTDLSRAHGDMREMCERIDIMRYGHAMVRPKPGVITAQRQAPASFGAIHFAHSDMSGVALFEEAFHHGVVAAEAVLRRRGIASDSIL